MATPATRTPVRIARGSYSNLNASVSDLQDGEISYAEDQDKLYIKEGSSLVALTYTPASPAFTGTITGVNLTLSGNLIVNGTTTTINTQTLDVEDKNIVIGKVSSPSDSTASGGGITLKGATDKTITWTDATDSWDFNQDVRLLKAGASRLKIGSTNASGAWLILDGDSNGDGAGDDYSYMHHDANGDFIIAGDNPAGNSNLILKSGNTTTALTLDSSQNATFAGQVAIPSKSTTYEGLELITPSGDGSGEFHIGVHQSGSSAGRSIVFRRGGSDGMDTESMRIDSSGNITGAGTVSDSKGNLRNIPQNSQTGSSNYDLVVADAGKHITRSGGDITIKNSTFQAGDAITIVNNNSTGGANITLTQESGLTMYLATDGTTGNRVLAPRGMCTILFTHTSYANISGAGLS